MHLSSKGVFVMKFKALILTALLILTSTSAFATPLSIANLTVDAPQLVTMDDYDDEEYDDDGYDDDGYDDDDDYDEDDDY